MENPTLKDLQEDIRSGRTDLRNVVSTYLRRIEEKDHLNAFLEVFGTEALDRADKITVKIRNGSAGKLAGMVIGLKDNICYKGHRVSASSKILEGFESLFNATVTERLLAEDAIVIGRLNCDEFAMGASNENSAFGPVLNDADPTRVPGGSSGGSAVAVQAGLCRAALGSDTGGSVRQPASFTGTFGIKPTYGRVSRYGLLAYASSFDQIGPITSSVEDMALILEVISGDDEMDATVSEKPVPPYTDLLQSDGKKRIGYIEDCLSSPGIDPEVREHTLEMIRKLQDAGHSVEPVKFPFLDYMVPCYYVLTTAEASSNLARYSGLLFGHRSDKASDLESTFKLSRSEGFGPEVQRRIMTGTFVLSSDHYDAYYTKAQKVRRVIQQRTNALLEEHDFILLPTTPGPAFKLGEKSSDPIAMYLADIFTVQAPLAGIPAISIPTGTHSNGMPFGLQLMAKAYEEAPLLAFSRYLYNLSQNE
ncbi:MAG: Asp-tRNA(Asn)/Glu-tRNA(Gln) amidotransferase subunit GatA [Flavobacteriales bacterium]|nr:Asp-tRNA(Asn)/Glu-tRNA(Gln) amidotransferase subunit GatA [Flavobacteriales bacterium]